MSPDIERAIEQLEAKIAELMSARDTLIETFDPPDSPRRRLVLARRASAATGARKRGGSPSPATAQGDSAKADPRVGPTISGATVSDRGADQGTDQGGAQGSELDYQNLGRRITRKDALAEFLREHGPSTRAEILHGLAIPPGSIAYVLNDRNRFVLVDGKWHNVPDQESAREPAGQGSGAEGQSGTERQPTAMASQERTSDKPNAGTLEGEPPSEV